MYGRLSIILALLASTVALAQGWNQVILYENSVTIHALAVSSNGSGSTINITITAIYPGNGDVYVSAVPLPSAESGTFLSSSKVASLVASYLANQPYNRYDFLIRSEPTTLEVGGPSASAYMAVAMWSLITNNTLNPRIVMTGMVLPDGTVGPVGGLDGKIAAAAREGYSVVLIPYGQQVYLSSNGLIDLINYGRRLGITVIPVLDIRDAIYYFTGIRLGVSNGTNPYVGVYDNITEFLWNRVYSRLVSSGAVNYSDARGLISEAIRVAGSGDYYTAASLGYQALINYYQNILSKYSTSRLVELANDLSEELDSVNESLRDYVITTVNIDVLVGIYDRVQEGRVYINSFWNAMNSGDIGAAVQYLSYARARVETLGDWLTVLHSLRGGSPVSEEDLRRLAGTYIEYAQSIVEYTISLMKATGQIVSATNDLVNELVSELSNAQDYYNVGLYELALSQALSVVSRDTSLLHGLFIPSTQSQGVYLLNVTNYLRRIANHNLLVAAQCGVLPLLSMAYLRYGDYLLRNYSSTNDVNSLITSLSLYEQSAAYSQALYELARASNSCSPQLISIPSNLTVVEIPRNNLEVNYSLLTLGLILVALVLVLGFAASRRISR